MTFNESNTVEAFVRDLLCGAGVPRSSVGLGIARGRSGLGWRYLGPSELPRQENDVLVENHLRDALIRLNPEIAAQPDRADEVLHRLRAILMAVRTDGIVRANERFAAWLNGECSMPFGAEGKHVTVRLVDFEDVERNRYVVSAQYTVRSGSNERRADLVLLVNGVPLVVIETKTAVRSSQSWLDGATQVHEDYERNIPELFVPNLCSVATEGKEVRYGAIGQPAEEWGPWRVEDDDETPPLQRIARMISSMLHPASVLNLLGSYTAYTSEEGHRRAKVIARYQQVEAANRIVDRVVDGHTKKGLLWHFQGSGKSLLMLFAARRLRLHPKLGNPTVIIVVDRVELDTQISGVLHAADAPNLEKADSRAELERLLKQDARKIIITTIFKFGEVEDVLNDRHSIVVLVDEAHRSQEGNLGLKMRQALPNAFLFGLTGTPINHTDRNTFFAFGAEEDENGYLSRYSFVDSIRDGATVPLRFEPRLPELHIDREAIDAEYAQLTGGLGDLDRELLSQTAARTAVLLKTPERVEKICADIAEHFQEKVAPNGFGAQVVTYDRKSCVLYKNALDRVLPPEMSEILMIVHGGEEEYADWRRTPDAEEKLRARFRDPNDPLKILIVTSKLLTGFNAPILHAMYLDKPLRDHTLLQAICRTNRPFGEAKTHGLIVDYLGIFDDVAQAIRFDEEGIARVVTNIRELVSKLPGALQKCLAWFPGVDRTVGGYEGLIAAQECLPDNEARDGFAADYCYLARLWEAISPDPCLAPHETDFVWLGQVYQSVQPSTGTGKLIWHTLGPRTISLIHRNVHVAGVQDDLETLDLDADLLEAALGTIDPDRKSKEIEIRVAERLRRHLKDPRFRALGERLEELRHKHEQGLLVSVEFLKALLQLARDVVEAEKGVEPASPEERGKAALTELFEEARNDRTPIMVERVVNDIDEIVRQVRFEGWETTHSGKRVVKQALRKTLFKYRLHREQALFGRAYAYIEQYYAC